MIGVLRVTARVAARSDALTVQTSSRKPLDLGLGGELAAPVLEVSASILGGDPWQGDVQVVEPLAISVGARSLTADQRLLGAYYEDLIEGVQVAGWSAPRRRRFGGDSLMGHPTPYLGIPGGRDPVAVDAALWTASGQRRSWRLLTSGLLENSGSSSGVGGDTRTWTAGGPHGRYEEQQVDLDLPAGHGRERGEIVRDLLTEAGSPTRIAAGRAITVPINVSGDRLARMANQVLLPELRSLYWDRQGIATTRDLLEWPAPTGTITEDHVLADRGDLGTAAAADGPTLVVVTGAAPPEDLDPDACGQQTTTTVRKVYVVMAPRVAVGRQLADGSVVASGVEAETPRLRLQERVTTSITTECGTVVAEREVVEGWRVPRTWRYELDAAGVIVDWHAGVYLYDSTTEGDAADAYAWPAERWGVVRTMERSYTYGETYLQRRVEESREYAVAAIHAKDRPAGVTTSWEGVDYQGGVLVLGSGQAVEHVLSPGFWPGSPVETLQLVRRATYEPSEDGDGYLTGETETVEALLVRQGAGRYWYVDGGESPDAFAAIRVSERIATTYEGVGEDRHRATKAVTGYRTWDQVSLETEERDGYLPRAQTRTDDAGSLRARSLTATVQAPGVEGVRIPRSVTYSLEWAQDAGELERFGWYQLVEGAALTVNLPLLYNPALAAGQVWRVSLPSLDYYWLVRLVRVRHQEDAAGYWTAVTGIHRYLAAPP